nr:MAG TPA: hypothetical protein [Caudoviricetes sp.]
MIVGFTILDYKGRQEQAVKFIQRYCLLESPEVAKNIVALGAGVNVFTPNVDADLLSAQPFKCAPIAVEDGKLLVASAVNFNIEFIFNGNSVRLLPTQYFVIEGSDLSQVATLVKRRLLRVYPDTGGAYGGNFWILSTGAWNDEGVWIDSQSWIDR